MTESVSVRHLKSLDSRLNLAGMTHHNDSHLTYTYCQRDVSVNWISSFIFGVNNEIGERGEGEESNLVTVYHRYLRKNTEQKPKFSRELQEYCKYSRIKKSLKKLVLN